MGLNIRFNGCLPPTYTCTPLDGRIAGSATTLPLEVFIQINFVADFIRFILILFTKMKNVLCEPPFGELRVTYGLHL